MSRTTTTRCNICGDVTHNEYPEGWIQVQVKHWNGHGEKRLDVCKSCAEKPRPLASLMQLPDELAP